MAKRIRQEYGDRLSLDFYDPRCLFWALDLFRYGIRGGEVTWVLGSRVISRGIPSWEELRDAIEDTLAQQ